MKKLINTLSLFSVLITAAHAQVDVHNPAAQGIYRGTPYLTTWSQRWLTNGNSSGAVRFLMSDTNGPVALWNFIAPFAGLQNTNALTGQQQSALNQIVSGTINNSLNFQGNSIFDAATLGSPEWDVSVPSVVSIAGGTLWGEFHPDASIISVNGLYTFAGNLVVGSGAMTTGLVPFYLQSFTNAIVGLPNATSAKIFAFAQGAQQPNPYFPFDGVVNFFVATDVNSGNFSVFVTQLRANGGFAIYLYYTTATLPPGYIYGQNQDPSLTLTATGLTPVYTIKVNTNYDLAILPTPPASSNLMAQGINFFANSFTGSAITSSIFVGPLYGDASHATGITPAQVGAVSTTDPSYLSIPTVTANEATDSARITASTNFVTGGTNVTAFTLYPLYPLTPSPLFSPTDLRPNVSIPGVPFVNTFGRRVWFYANFARTNFAGMSVTLTNWTTTMSFTWSWTNTASPLSSGFGSSTVDMPASPGDTIQMNVNATTNLQMIKAWAVGM